MLVLSPPTLWLPRRLRFTRRCDRPMPATSEADCKYGVIVHGFIGIVMVTEDEKALLLMV